MSQIVQLSDFETGLYEINFNSFQEKNLQWYIDKYEKHYLLLLLGIDEYDNFINDLVSGVPQTAKYITIFDPLEFYTNDEVLKLSSGIKEMLLGFIYFHYVRDTNNVQTTVGAKRKRGENSDNISLKTLNIQKRYNDSVETYMNIGYYMDINDSTYSGVITQPLDYSLAV